MGLYKPPKRMGKFKKFVIFVLLLGILGTVGYFGYHYLSLTNKIFGNKKNIFTRVGDLFISNDKPLIGEDEGTVNVLLLGVGGEGHDGAYLTDTMIVASINTQTSEVVMTSIPRDWKVTIPKHGLNKINAVYAYALQDNNNDQTLAGEAAIQAAESVTGFDIPYFAIVDFKGFVKAVDHVGGLDISVERTFTDATFPNDFPYDTKGYLSPVTFTKGTEHMDGRRALIFARSRHSSNAEEASDFARSERQKKIIVALKDKLLGLDITNISTLNNLLSDFTSNFRTNLEPYELLRLGNIGKDINTDHVYSLSLEPQGNLICDTTIDQITGKPYIRPVTPAPDETDTTDDDSSGTTTKTDNSNTNQKTSTSNTADTASPTPTPSPTVPTQIPMYIVEPCAGKTLADINKFLVDYWDTARLEKEAAEIDIQNSTGKSAAAAVWKNLPSSIDATTVPFPGKTAFERTILYDNTHGSKPKTLQYLKDHYNFTIADVGYPNSKADFVVVIGNDTLSK